MLSESSRTHSSCGCDLLQPAPTNSCGEANTGITYVTLEICGHKFTATGCLHFWHQLCGHHSVKNRTQEGRHQNYHLGTTLYQQQNPWKILLRAIEVATGHYATSALSILLMMLYHRAPEKLGPVTPAPTCIAVAAPRHRASHWCIHQKYLILKMSSVVMYLTQEWYPGTDRLRTAVEVKGNHSPSFTQFSCNWVAQGQRKAKTDALTLSLMHPPWSPWLILNCILASATGAKPCSHGYGRDFLLARDVSSESDSADTLNTTRGPLPDPQTQRLRAGRTPLGANLSRALGVVNRYTGQAELVYFQWPSPWCGQRRIFPCTLTGFTCSCSCHGTKHHCSLLPGWLQPWF